MKRLIYYLLAFGIAYAGVEIFRRWSLRREIFDVPNARSSHRVPTPRGGGLIVMAICLTFYLLGSGESFSAAYFIAALIIGLISWLDDLKNISFIWRFAAHSAAAGMVIWELGYWTEINLPFFGEVKLGFFGLAITFFWIVWLTNAYNFMDGIDGIAATQAVTAGAGWLMVGRLLGIQTIEFYGGVVACASLGFLLHNWQPAKIFMGDVGSAFLGFTFAALPLLARFEKHSIKPDILPVIALTLVLLFVCDTLLTFIKRLFNGEKVWEAHRRHVYQTLIIRGFSHQSVTLLYGLASLLILGGLIFWLKNNILTAG